MKENGKGLFVVFEGGDGCGKGTQISKSSEWLTRHGVNHIVTREPGGTKLAEYIRTALKTPPEGWEAIDPDTEMLLFNAARMHHVNQVIRPALNSGLVVLCDRFVDSTFAYQGQGRGLELSKLMDFHRMHIELYPDLTILLDGDPESLQDRMKERGLGKDRFDDLDLEFHRRVRTFYLSHAMHQNKVNSYGKHLPYAIVDAMKSKEDVFTSIIPYLEDIKALIKEDQDPIQHIGL